MTDLLPPPVLAADHVRCDAQVRPVGGDPSATPASDDAAPSAPAPGSHPLPVDHQAADTQRESVGGDPSATPAKKRSAPIEAAPESHPFPVDQIHGDTHRALGDAA